MVALTEKRYDMALTQEGTRTMTKKLSCLNRQCWPKPPKFWKPWRFFFDYNRLHWHPQKTILIHNFLLYIYINRQCWP